MVMELRDVMKRLPPDGQARHAIRKFNQEPNVGGKARSVKDLAEEIGFDVHQTDLPRGTNGLLVKDAFSDHGYLIEIDRSLSVEAKRFAVLHEIGHYFLHRDQSVEFEDFHFDLKGSAFYPDLVQEREANQFAAAILFGAGSLRAARMIHGNDLEALRRHFGVTRNVLMNAMRDFRID